MINIFDPKILKISKNEIIAVTPCYVALTKEEYDFESIVNTDEKIVIPGIFDIFFPSLNDFGTFVVNYDVNLMKTGSVEESSGAIIVHYAENEVMIKQETYDNVEAVGGLIRILQGRVKYLKSPEAIVKILNAIVSDADLIHFEVIVSNMLRSKSDPTKKTRLSGKINDSVVYGQTKQGMNDSWLSAMAYRDIRRGISKGLVSGQNVEKNPIENVINGDIYEVSA